MPVAAQDCQGYWSLQQNKVITMSLYDRNEKSSGTYVYRVVDVKSNDEISSSVVEGTLSDDKGKQVSSNVCHLKCSNGLYQVDMKMLLPQQQQEQFKKMDARSSFFLEYPAGMEVGDQLKEGSFSTSMRNDKGPEMSMEMTIADRQVVGEEEISTPAGTWKCFRITFRCKVRTRVGGIGIPFQIDNTEWFAPAFGIVKTVSKWGSSVITAIQ